MQWEGLICSPLAKGGLNEEGLSEVLLAAEQWSHAHSGLKFFLLLQLYEPRELMDWSNQEPKLLSLLPTILVSPAPDHAPTCILAISAPLPNLSRLGRMAHPAHSGPSLFLCTPPPPPPGCWPFSGCVSGLRLASQPFNKFSVAYG